MINSISYSLLGNRKYYLLKDVFNLTKLHTYVPERLLKDIDNDEVLRVCLQKSKGGIAKKKTIYVTEDAAKQILNKYVKSNTISLFEKTKLARKYGVSEGFITAHLYAGDLEEQLEYRRKFFGIEDEVKSYSCRDFTKKTMW
jgi:hypothetical protein